MDVFRLRRTLVDDYQAYIKSFITIQDKHILGHVENALEQGHLWPEPLIQLNPNFEPGAWIEELVADNVLRRLASQIFRLDKEKVLPGRPMRLHKHQSDAVRAARSGDNYVLTTGTGSGKSLSYIVPVVDHILRRGSGRGIQAIIVYPMNALANSQINELDKFLKHGFGDNPPVTYQRYTGQENKDEKQAIVRHPPDILLTNYVMLELIMTRPEERALVNAMRGLQFLVLDELHTYRGRQGADVAMLIRRVRDVCENPSIQCVGTSATLAEGGSFQEQQQKIAEVASTLFGSPVQPERIIGETLRRVTPAYDLRDPGFVTRLRQTVPNWLQQPPQDFDAFVTDPLAVWIETTFGLTWEEETGRLKRAIPMSLTGTDGAAAQLAQQTGHPVVLCVAAIESALLAGYAVSQPETGLPVFAFRLHQFISRGDTVYASLEEPTHRYITLNGQKYVPNERQKLLFPISFCRECGQEYYVVNRVENRGNGQLVFLPRQLRDQALDDEDAVRGFLYHNPAYPWVDDLDTLIDEDRLPEDWLERGGERIRVKSRQRKKLPEAITLNTLGEEATDGLTYHFVQSPFPFCLCCGVTYSGREKSDFSRLSTLSSEGRSTATTVLSLSTLRALRRDETLRQTTAQKLLSFTDNRQDASLQAGHFNDFVEVGLVRAALYRAVQAAGSGGLEHDQLALRVFQALDLPLDLYVNDPESAANRSKRRLAEQALRDVLGYRVYQDLRRGWRITAPNLEQCGLLQIDYLDLPDICSDETLWSERHPALATATAEQRTHICKILLDVLRRGLAIRVDYLDAIYQEGMKQRSNQHLIIPWAIDETEQLTHDFIAVPGSARARSSREYLFVSARSGFGMFLRRTKTFPEYRGRKLNLDETQTIIEDLFQVLAKEGILDKVEEPRQEGDLPGYQLNAALMVWQEGDGTSPYHDPLRMPRLPDEALAANRANPFFVSFYQAIALQLKGVEAREHTAQVPSDERQRREDAFREATLPVLYCSPTMELGVDIAQLNVVNMRNVPPTPANYAQRSGRAGRRGQPALVFTYCTTGSPHDQYFFKRPAHMVAGSVRPPRLDLSNEDLIRAHVHAVWLAETGQDLGNSLKDLLNLEESPLALKPELVTGLEDPSARQKAEKRLHRILGSIAAELQETPWYSADWLHQTLTQTVSRFNEAGDRWRELYRSALKQRDRQDEIVRSPVSSSTERKQAQQLRREAENQLALLLEAQDVSYSDFYSYRYFASEGFLPGYNFPRLPLSAFIPGRRGRRRDEKDEFLSRPRFLAIAEFGPRSIIYHEGSRYIINKAILPVGIDEVLTTRAKVCERCGYLHPISDQANPDRCDNCQALLPAAMVALFRMQNVGTKRRDRISSDEEERMRLGYELQTTVRFQGYDGRPAFSTAAVKAADGRDLLKLTYGSAATIWRINKGWRRRRNPAELGFVLDVERGYWKKNDLVETDPDDPMSERTQRVIPFVEDRRNCLLLEFAEIYDIPIMASLQPALKSAIQVLYQLEDNELAVEPLPTWDDRRLILFYEAAEGGAGVLRQLVNDPQAIKLVARKALELCHFDPDTRTDLRHAPGASEDCEAACYDCLMSYFNQPDHRLLDRNLLKTPLFELAQSTVHISPTTQERESHWQQLQAACESELEREWLAFIYERNLLLPDVAQKLIEACQTRCDFYYRDKGVAIYVDGLPHDQPFTASQDAAITDCLVEDLGLTVLRFRYDNRDAWERICTNHAYVFGKIKA